LSLDVVLWLSAVTLSATLLSTILFYYATRPVLHSIHRITEQTRLIANGHFQEQITLAGPKEIQDLAGQFNNMSLKLYESFERLRTSETSRRELVENVSHDLRTPLASIRSYVEALQDHVVRDEETFDRYLSTIAMETERLSGMKIYSSYLDYKPGRLYMNQGPVT
jgi:two-component system sensor histidine kinase SaeS